MLRHKIKQLSLKFSQFRSRAKEKSPSMRWVGRISGILALIALSYYPIGMALLHKIDDDLAFPAPIPNQAVRAAAQTIATAIALIERETITHRWTANDPWFYPSAMLDNMPNFQQGIIASLGRFAIEMTDQIGRVRGSSEADADLEKAAGLLKYSGNIWVFDFSTSLAPTATSEAQYKAAARSLRNYNDRLAAGQAVFEKRADNLLATMGRISNDLGSASALIDQGVVDLSTLSTETDDIFYRNKGKLYAYALLMRDLGADFSNIIREKELNTAWAQMLLSLEQAANMDPVLVTNGAPDGLIFPSHLAGQGFYLLRARAQMNAIINVLLK